MALDSNHPAAQEALSPNLDWNEGGRVHNWRNWVCDTLRDAWSILSDDQKIAVAINADEIASGREEWD